MRRDYTHSRTAPVAVVFIEYRGKILLLKRSDRVLCYRNLWSNLAGFLDDESAAADKARQEIKEELGLGAEAIAAIERISVYPYDDQELGRTWLRHVFLARLNTDKIRLNEEHTDYRWIRPEEVKNFDVTPGLAADLSRAVKLLS